MNLFEKLIKYRREKHLGQCGHNMFAIEQHRAMADYLAREIADEVPTLIRSLRAIARRPYTSADDLAADILAALGASAEEVEARSRGVSDEKAISAWSSLMRPRPVARWGAPAGVTNLYVGRAVLGYVLTSQSGGESAVCGITGEHFRGYDARAWLEARVRAAGFEVREEVSDE